MGPKIQIIVSIFSDCYGKHSLKMCMTKARNPEITKSSPIYDDGNGITPQFMSLKAETNKKIFQ